MTVKRRIRQEAAEGCLWIRRLGGSFVVLARAISVEWKRAEARVRWNEKLKVRKWIK